MIKQAYISESLAGLDFMGKYGLTEYLDSKAPLVLFGMYRPEDLHTYMHHDGPLNLVWQGSDARNLTPSVAEILNRRSDVKHYAISHWIERSLQWHGIQCKHVPISATQTNVQPCALGDSIYFYSSSLETADMLYYGGEYLAEIERRTGLNIIIGHLTKWNKEELHEQYRRCFINLRLTSYDGCPNTVLEMGLMGRRSIFNGRIPGSISWEYIDDICDSIMNEYRNRYHADPYRVNRMITEYLNIDLDFLQPKT